jgi:hypothetical protein
MSIVEIPPKSAPNAPWRIASWENALALAKAQADRASRR